jgi:hypothetical protein
MGDIADNIPGVVSMLFTRSPEGTLFTFLAHDQVKPKTIFQEQLLATGLIKIRKVSNFSEDISSGGKVFPAPDPPVNDIAEEYGTVGHFLSTEPYHEADVQGNETDVKHFGVTANHVFQENAEECRIETGRQAVSRFHPTYS